MPKQIVRWLLAGWRSGRHFYRSRLEHIRAIVKPPSRAPFRSALRIHLPPTDLPLLQRSLLQRSLLLDSNAGMAKDYSLGKFLTHCTIILWLLYLLMMLRGQGNFVIPGLGGGKGSDAPLVMQGGDPYVRALMRTISASESNVANPYAVIYGGDYTQDLSQHPDRCIQIPVGPNTGNCSTAAGRYQFITTTWLEQSHTYHPSPSGLWLWQHYSFEPVYQDIVVYRWLSDPKAWGVDIPALLREGQVTTVLQLLSPTWTSLGYGIETNSMSGALPQVYQQVLREELGIIGQQNPSENKISR